MCTDCQYTVHTAQLGLGPNPFSVSFPINLCICTKFSASNYRQSAWLATEERTNLSGISRCLALYFQKGYEAPEILKKCPKSPNALDRKKEDLFWKSRHMAVLGKVLCFVRETSLYRFWEVCVGQAIILLSLLGLFKSKVLEVIQQQSF